MASIASIILALEASTGAIKAKATQVVAQGRGIQGSEATFQLTGDSLSNLQDQINSLRRNSLGLATYVSNVVVINPSTDDSVTLNGYPVPY